MFKVLSFETEYVKITTIWGNQLHTNFLGKLHQRMGI